VSSVTPTMIFRCVVSAPRADTAARETATPRARERRRACRKGLVLTQQERPP